MLDGKVFNGMLIWEMFKVLMVMIFEGCMIFCVMSIEENFIVGVFVLQYCVCVKDNLECVYIMFLKLCECCCQLVGLFLGGEVQMLVMVCGLMFEFKLFIIDEFLLGLVLVVVNEFFEILV